MGGNKIITPHVPSARAVVLPEEKPAQSRASPREEIYHGRFSLKAPKKQVRLESDDQPETGSIGPGSVCNKILNPALPFHQLMPRSSSRGNNSISPRMENDARICPSLLVSYTMGTMENAAGRSYSGSSCPSMTESAVVLQIVTAL